MFEEYQQIVLSSGVIRAEGEDLNQGEVGAYIHIHPNRKAYIAEILSLESETMETATIPPSTARPVAGHDIS